MSKQVVDLRVGMIGWSAEAIAIDKTGYCYFPLGEIDPTYAGGRKWVKVRVTALENVREERDVIVADEELNVKEHTPVELSYERSAGGFQRVTEDYPLPVVPYFNEEGAPSRVTDSNPLPVTAGSKAIIHVTVEATALGNTEIITPSTGKKIRVHWYSISNKHITLADVGMRFRSDGTIKHRYGLPADGGTVACNLIDANWEGDTDEALYAYLAAAYATGVYFNVGYTEEE